MAYMDGGPPDISGSPNSYMDLWSFTKPKTPLFGQCKRFGRCICGQCRGFNQPPPTFIMPVVERSEAKDHIIIS